MGGFFYSDDAVVAKKMLRGIKSSQHAGFHGDSKVDA